MKSWLACVFGVLFLSVASGQLLRSDNLAANLSTAMRLDEFVANRWNSWAVRIHQLNQSSPDRLRCAASAFKAVEFTVRAPKVLEALFTTAELAEALKFYESKLGQRWVEFTFDLNNSTDAGTPPKVILSTEEKKELSAFFDTGLGSRVGEMKHIIISRPATEIFDDITSPAMRRCPAPPR